MLGRYGWVAATVVLGIGRDQEVRNSTIWELTGRATLLNTVILHDIATILFYDVGAIILFLFLFLMLFFILFEKHREKEKDRGLSSIVSLPKFSQQSGLGQAEGSSPELHLNLTRVARAQVLEPPFTAFHSMHQQVAGSKPGT